VIFVVSKTKQQAQVVSIVFRRAIRKCQIFAFETRSLISIKVMFVQVGYRIGCQEVEEFKSSSGIRFVGPACRRGRKKESMPARFVVGAHQDEQLRFSKKQRSKNLKSNCNGNDGIINVTQSRLASQKRDMSHLPSSSDGLLLHPGGRNRWRWARHGNASHRVDDRNGIACAGGRGLMKLEGRLVTRECRRNERRR
jgi:hypothetical protein